DGRHFGLVVDDKEAARRALKAAGVKVLPGRFLDFRDPWGNRIEIVGYDNIQFTKAPNVLRGMGLTRLAKNESAKKELAAKGMAAERRTFNDQIWWARGQEAKAVFSPFIDRFSCDEPASRKAR